MPDMPVPTMPVSDREGRPLSGFTRMMDYPGIAASKYEAAIARIAKVHARFQKELDAICDGIAGQTALSAAAIERYRQVGPCLESIGSNARSLGADMRQVTGRLEEGRKGLETAVVDVRSSISRLRERNLAMRDILDLGGQVTASVNKIAEIAVENKLIAINASVTASKASDKVKGFKVIASEITKLSAAMTDKVGGIVALSAQVDERMQQVMRNMDGSIQSTEKALGSIDEAFSLLDHAEGAVREAEAAGTAMIAENENLERTMQTLGASLEAIATIAADSGRQAEAIRETMRRQAGLIEGLEGMMPGLREASKALAAAGGPVDLSVADGPRHLRCSEAPLTSYDPALCRMLRESHYISLVCIRLLRYSSDKKLVPYLAETWFLHPDGRTWEFRLKDDVFFSDGSRITSRDVRFSLERLMNPALASPYANLFSVVEGADDFIAGRASSVSGIVLPGPDTVQFRLKSSYNFFLSLLALSYSSVIKEDRSVFSRPLARGNVVSAGPFVPVENGDPDVDLLAANKDFVNGRPFLDSMEIRRNVADVPAAMARGDLDLAYNLPASSAEAMRQGGFAGGLDYYTSRYCYGLVVNFSRRSCLSRSADLRRAVAMAIDKDAIVDGILGGKAVRADAILPPELVDLGGRRFIPHDPAEAARIVQRLKVSEDLDKPVNLAIRGYANVPNQRQVAEKIEADLAKIGLRVVTSYHPQGTPIDSFRNDYDIVFLAFLSELDLYSAVEPFINPQGGDNYFGYDNPRLFGMLNDSIIIKDNDARKEAFIGILEGLARDVFSVPLFFNKCLLATQPGVRSVFMSAEESFLPDAAYLVSGSMHADGSGKGGSADPAAIGVPAVEGSLRARYADTIGRLERGTSVVVGTAGSLIETGKGIGSSIGRQKKGTNEANDLFASFMDSAARVQETRAGVVERIRIAAEEAGKSGRAAGLVRTGLLALSNALSGTISAIDQVSGEIKAMSAIVRSIEESNVFIGSIAINAAVISAKADAGRSELVKVSQSIADLARQNTDYTDTIGRLLGQMAKAVKGHHDFLGGELLGVDGAAEAAKRSGAVLEEAAPLLEDSGLRSSRIESASLDLATLIQEARHSVARINEAIDALAESAETLQFGLDMERGVSDILKDVAWLNRDVMEYVTEAGPAAPGRG
jgi:ABC-type transport system substrate-binding protein/methyl-accepting chemotaxis protein